MGFHVEISDDDRRLLEKLRSAPEEVFGPTYAGYLFFLIGDSDESAVQWLRANLVALDSLTRQFIAFAIFADRVPVHIKVSAGEKRFSKLLGSIKLNELNRLTSDIRHGRFGWVADGDYLMAMTYGSDTIARKFGVVKHLPCVICLDAFSPKKLEVVSLAEDQLPGMLDLFRSAIDRLFSAPHFSDFSEALSLLSDLDRQYSHLVRDLDQAKSESAEFDDVDVEQEIIKLFRDIELAMRQGSYREVMRAVESLSVYSKHAIRLEIDESTGMRLKGYARTISALQRFESERWPLSIDQLAQYQETFEKHVLRLMPGLSVPTADSRLDSLRDTLDRLRRGQDRFIAELLATLPDVESLKSAIRARHLQSQGEVAYRIRSLGSEIELLQQKALVVQAFFKRGSIPSLGEAVASAARALGAKHFATELKQGAIAISAKFLEPENVMKILRAVTGTPG